MNNVFSRNVERYKLEIDKSLAHCAERKDWSSLSTHKMKHLFKGKEIEILPQHAVYNSIIESYIPEDLDMFSNKLYYFGDFSKDSIDAYIKKMHNAIFEYATKKAGKWYPDKYFQTIDKFNIENASSFYSENYKYEKWEDLWNGIVAAEPDKATKKDMLIATEIYNIIMQNIQFSYTLYSYLFDEKILVFFNGLQTYEDVCNADERASQIIKHSIFDNKDSIFETLRKRNEAGKYVMNVISKYKIEPLNTMIQSGSAIKEEQLTDMIIGLGIKPFINDASHKILPKPGKLTRPYGSFVYNKTIHASYIRGLKNKEDHFVSISSAVTSMIISKSKIEAIADLNKKLTLVSKRMEVHPERDHKCGTKHFREYTIKKESDLRRIKGMYEQVGAKTIKIDDTNFAAYKGRTIKLRTPAFCNSTMEGGVCRYCMGDHMYDLNSKWYFRKGSHNVATVWVNIVGPEAQQSLLSAKHNASPNPLIPTYWLLNDLNKPDYNIKDSGIEFVYAYEDRVFINYKGMEIIPDELELVNPDHMYMPWTNVQTAKFSHRIRFRIDNEWFTAESDTLFFIYDSEGDKPNVNLRHLYQNIGITSLFYKLKSATMFGTNENPNKRNVNVFLDLLDDIDPKQHIAFFHVLFADMIREKDHVNQLVDYSREDLDLEVVTLDVAIKKGSNLTNTFATGYFKEHLINPDNYSTNNKVVVDTDNVI